jgi:deazaflavin-dependent oxidoreductase (nitroreductase family)
MSDKEDPRAWIARHVEQYLADGEAGHLWDSSMAGGPGPLPTLLLTTVGRKSGEERIMPLLYSKIDRGYVLVASKGGAPQHPAWYLNLLARPAVKVQVANDRFDATARVAGGDERARLWEQMADMYPPYRDYQAKTSREIPIVVLEPREVG